MTVALALTRDSEVPVQILWGARFAAIRERKLVVILPFRRPGSDGRGSDVDLEAEAEGDQAHLIRAVQEAIAADPELRIAPPQEEGAEPTDTDEGSSTIDVRMRLLPFTDPLKAMVDEIHGLKASLLAAVRKELDTDSEHAEVRRALFRRAPCELAFVRLGNADPGACSRVMAAATDGPHGKLGLKMTEDLATLSGEPGTALRVNPDIGADSTQVGLHSLDKMLKRSFGKDSPDLLRHVVVDNQPHRGIAQAAEDGDHDVVIVGASTRGALGQRLLGTVGGKIMRAAPSRTVIMVRASNPIASRFGHALESYLQRVVPQLQRAERIDLVERVQSNSQFDFDFITLIALSTIIAAIGLMQSSAAVVIGAMLVAPLMTPILGLGIALVQGNPAFTRMTIHSILFGFLVAVAASSIVGGICTLAGFQEPTPEMLARGGPGLLDLFVAFASGVAAAYASSRPNLLAALPGVAIAAALVPPIATSGLALSIGEFRLAIGATLLFVINMVTIVLASQLSLWAVGIRNVKRKSQTTTRVGQAILLSVIALAVYLSVMPPSQDIENVLPEPGIVVAAIEERLGVVNAEAKARGEDLDYTLRRIDLSHTERGYEVIVRVTGNRLAPAWLSEDIRQIARRALNKPVEVRTVTQWDVHGDD